MKSKKSSKKSKKVETTEYKDIGLFISVAIICIIMVVGLSTNALINLEQILRGLS